MLRFNFLLILCIALDWLGLAAAARAQNNMAGCRAYQQQTMTLDKVAEDHYVLKGTADAPVQIDCDDMQLFADQLESFRDEGRIVARGNIVYVSGGNRISAERMEFNTKTRTGTFYVAFGTATLRDKPNPGPFGGQEPDAYFWGDELRKVGPKKFTIVRGGFTTCVQPTPRWDVQSGSITINLDDYVLLRNAIFRVKDVPVMYLPVFYYPIQEDDRATGFLMPVYGSTTARGQSISNSFFWAVSRSQDVTLYHDWFSKTGQQIGGEYRYIAAPGSQGNSQVSFLNERATISTDARRSYNVRGDLTQRLPLAMTVRGNADYFSSIVTQQRYQQDIFLATRRSRRFGANLNGSWKEYSLSATADRNDYFDGDTSFTTNGSLPRISVSRGERPIGGSPVYFGANSEVVTIQRSTTTNDVRVEDKGLSRVDVNSSLRFPFTRWPFLTVNSSVSWRGTYWTESLDEAKVQVPESIGRRFFDVQARITGPVFNRIWNAEGNGYADKFKHVIEPSLTIQRTTAIDNVDRIVQLDGTDSIIGTTQYSYALANRLYAKKDVSREILSATVSQSYYTVARASQFDPQVQSSFNNESKPTNFSAVMVQLRGTPTDRLQAAIRTEWDPTAHALRTLAASGGFNNAWIQTTVGWSQRRYIPTLSGFDVEANATNYLNATTNIRRAGGRVGGSYSFNYDLRGDAFLQQRYTAYYNAQCCGVGIEYQTFNFRGSVAGAGLAQDRRFNLSFTLAGIGTFSNLFGAFGQQNR